MMNFAAIFEASSVDHQEDVALGRIQTNSLGRLRESFRLLNLPRLVEIKRNKKISMAIREDRKKKFCNGVNS